jgi:hypothetical protein
MKHDDQTYFKSNFKDIIGEESAGVLNELYVEFLSINSAWNAVSYYMEMVRKSKEDCPAYLKENHIFFNHFKVLSFNYIYSAISRLMDPPKFGKNDNNSVQALQALLAKENYLYPKLGKNTCAYQAQDVAYNELKSLYDEGFKKLRDKFISHNDRDAEYNFDLSYPTVLNLINALRCYFKVLHYNYSHVTLGLPNDDYDISGVLGRLKKLEIFRHTKQ